MPVLSDFTIIDKNEFVTRSATPIYSRSFNTGGRHNSNALLDIAILGGFRSGDENMSVRVRVNGVNITTFTANRWTSHSTIVYDRISAVVDPSILRSSGNNTLELIPSWEANSDYMFLGPIVCHFHQAA
mgnify:CR=1 FL=1